MNRLAIIFVGLIISIYGWYLIFRYFGHYIPQSSINFCYPLKCPYPDFYKISFFGYIWIYSTIGVVLLLLLFILIKKNWNSIVVFINHNKWKIGLVLLAIIATSTFSVIFGPRFKQEYELHQKYENALIKLNNKDYIGSIKDFKAIIRYKDSQQRIQEAKNKLEKEAEISFKKGNYIDVVYDLTFLQSKAKKDQQFLTASKYLIKEQEKERLTQLKAIAPYDGMLEADIPLSSWGKPTKIDLCLDYYNLRADHQFKYYEWVSRNKDGQITEIKNLQVNQGAVYGKPSISRYDVH